MWNNIVQKTVESHGMDQKEGGAILTRTHLQSELHQISRPTLMLIKPKETSSVRMPAMPLSAGRSSDGLYTWLGRGVCTLLGVNTRR
jgi:hypothetical protein